jgi:hypothetical protein
MSTLAVGPVTHRALYEIVSDHETDMRNLRGLAAVLYAALMEAGPLDEERAEGLGFVATELLMLTRKINTLCDTLYDLSREPT